MSLIMDALRKSERQRQRSLAGQLSSMAPSPRPAGSRAPWGLLIGVLLLINAVLGATLLWRQGHEPPATASAMSAVQSPREVPAQPQVRSLAAEAAAGAPAPSAPERSDSGDEPGKASGPAAAQANAPAVAQSQTDASDADVVPLDALPDSFRQSLPDLHLDVHSYSSNPAQRFVLINMHRYQQGDVLSAGPRVVRITPEGVILEFRGQRFLLPRQ